MKYAKSYIGEIIKFYVDNPKYIILSISLSILFLAILLNIFPDWTIYQYITIWLISIPTFILIIGQTAGYWKETKLEEEYEKILREPFKQKFIIPSKDWTIINYEKQINKPQRKDEINIPTNTKATIFIRTNSKLDLEIRDSQYSFDGDKKKKPKILKYNNPYYTKSIAWYDEDAFDWHDIYHLKGARTIFKDVTYVDGFKIKTHNKGQYNFNMEFIVLCKKYNKLKKEKSKSIKTSLKINVI
jgi:hypothetical protein